MTDVSFSYPGDDNPLLSNINLRIEPGKTIAIRADDTGSGKTTLLHLMTGVLEPDTGTVRLGDYNISELSPATKGRAISYLPSKGPAMKGTILENLTMFRPHRMPIVLELSRRLGLDEITAQLPRGYETIIGDGVGDTLSQGVMQRISLVRGLADSRNSFCSTKPIRPSTAPATRSCGRYWRKPRNDAALS